VQKLSSKYNILEKKHLSPAWYRFSGHKKTHHYFILLDTFGTIARNLSINMDILTSYNEENLIMVKKKIKKIDMSPYRFSVHMTICT
jgi:hypothetical protein